MGSEEIRTSFWASSIEEAAYVDISNKHTYTYARSLLSHGFEENKILQH